MSEQLSVLEQNIRELRESMLINSLTNIASCEIYPLEAREDAARRVQTLLGLAQTQNFIEEQNLPNNIVRYEGLSNKSDRVTTNQL